MSQASVAETSPRHPYIETWSNGELSTDIARLEIPDDHLFVRQTNRSGLRVGAAYLSNISGIQLPKNEYTHAPIIVVSQRSGLVDMYDCSKPRAGSGNKHAGFKRETDGSHTLLGQSELTKDTQLEIPAGSTVYFGLISIGALDGERSLDHPSRELFRELVGGTKAAKHHRIGRAFMGLFR